MAEQFSEGSVAGELFGITQEGSGPFELPSREDLQRIGRGAIVAFAGFAAAYITTDVIPQFDQKNAFGMLLVAVLSVAVNAFRVWSQDTRESIGKPIQVNVVDGVPVIHDESNGPLDQPRFFQPKATPEQP